MARRFFGGSLSIGLESEEVQQAEQEQAVAQTEVDAAGAESVETELLEVNDAVEEGSQRSEALDQADAVVDELEDDKEALEVAAENGGIDRAAADFLRRKVAFHAAQLGLNGPRLPATESFGGASSRLGATQVALEGVSDLLRKAWEAIINTIKKSINWVKGLFLKVFGSSEQLLKRAKAIAEKADNTTGNIDTDKKKFENDRLYAALNIAGKVDHTKLQSFFSANMSQAFEDVLSKSNDFDKMADNLAEFDPDKYNGSTDIANDINDAVVQGSKTTGEIVDELQKFCGFSATNMVSDKRAQEGYAITMSAELPGGRAFFVRAMNGTPSISAVRAYFGDFYEKPKTKEGVQNETWPAAKVSTIANEIVSFAEDAVRARKDFDKLAERKDKLVKAVEKLSKVNFNVEENDVKQKSNAEGVADTKFDEAGAKAHNKAGNAALREVRKTILAINKVGTDLPAQTLQYGLTVAKATLDYCEISLKNHSA